MFNITTIDNVIFMFSTQPTLNAQPCIVNASSYFVEGGMDMMNFFLWCGEGLGWVGSLS